MEKYAFVTKWQIRAPVERVWDAIYESTEWPHWWKGAVDVHVLQKGDEDGLNEVRSYTWKSVLPYKLSFQMKLTQKHPPKYMRGEAVGELEGLGEWFLEQHEDITHVQYNWDVFTNKKWMNHLSFILKPLFKYNHNIVMRRGARGLAKKLNAELVCCK
jgi:uncharacterized protein YndB with AHSA1/START domain